MFRHRQEPLPDSLERGNNARVGTPHIPTGGMRRRIYTSSLHGQAHTTMKQNTERLDIYSSRADHYERELVKLKASPISQRNKDVITTWHNHLFARRSGEDRVAKLSSQLRIIAQWLHKDLDQVTREDLENLVSAINRRGIGGETWAEATKADYRRAVKQFYAWYEDEDERVRHADERVREIARRLYQYLHKHVRADYRPEAIDPSEILTEEDIQLVLAKGARTPRDKAFIAVLHEAGLRAGEYLNLRMKDVEIRDTHAILNVDGKTGRRRVTIVQSIPYLVTWLGMHPFNGNPQAFVWVQEAQCTGPTPLHHQAAQKLIERAFERAGLYKREYVETVLESGKVSRRCVRKEKVKPMNLHWFRHSRATLLAPKVSESVLCKFFGWTMGSKQVRTYVHMSGQQVESALLSAHGIIQQAQQPTVRQCSCGAPNQRQALYCFRCGKPMDVSVALQEKNALADAFKAIQLIMQNPELKRQYEQELARLDNKNI